MSRLFFTGDTHNHLQIDRISFKNWPLGRELNAMILAGNSRALRQKAHTLGYDDIEINGFGDLKNDDYSIAKPALVDESSFFLATLLEKYYGIEMIGFSETEE